MKMYQIHSKTSIKKINVQHRIIFYTNLIEQNILSGAKLLAMSVYHVVWHQWHTFMAKSFAPRQILYIKNSGVKLKCIICVFVLDARSRSSWN